MSRDHRPARGGRGERADGQRPRTSELRPEPQVARAVAQQGRVTVEADWNEAAAIDAERDRAADARHRRARRHARPAGYCVTAVPAGGRGPGDPRRPDHRPGHALPRRGAARPGRGGRPTARSRTGSTIRPTRSGWPRRVADGDGTRARLSAGLRAGGVGRRGSGPRRRRPRRPGHHAAPAHPPALRPRSRAQAGSCATARGAHSSSSLGGDGLSSTRRR